MKRKRMSCKKKIMNPKSPYLRDLVSFTKSMGIKDQIASNSRSASKRGKKKSNHLALIYFKSNTIDIPFNT